VSYQYVIDPTAKRLVEAGLTRPTIEDAYMLSYNVEKRVEMQAWMQQFVDHGISSTINLPYPITDPKEVVSLHGHPL
jgi:ribonucleoside-diphosphate reductase alpha chain